MQFVFIGSSAAFLVKHGSTQRAYVIRVHSSTLPLWQCLQELASVVCHRSSSCLYKVHDHFYMVDNPVERMLFQQ